MKLKFDAGQQYQLDAIEAVTDLFDGQQTTSSASFLTSAGMGLFQNEHGIGNLLQLDETAVLQNLRQVQARNGVPLSEEFKGNNFTVEMETGTGKTYVYLRTMFELYKRYGFAKFIIVVPGKAIREGVLKSLEITREHFGALYGNPPYRFFAYQSKRPADLRAFATSNSLSAMLINIEAFNTEDNVMNRANDRIGGVPIELVQQTRPIVILDEPQNMETEIARAAIDRLNPLCTLRYSATHRELYNQVYRLGPVEAYDQGLVKRIEVASVREEGAHNDAYVKVVDIKATPTLIKARLEIEAKSVGGISKKSVEAKIHRTRETEACDLYELSGRLPAYEGFVVSGIDAERGEVEFGNGVVVSAKQGIGELDDAIRREQIAETIREHLEKMLKFKERGEQIKVLSLFFIDKVAHYRDHERGGAPGKFATWFVEEYEKLRALPKYKPLSLPPVDKVHDGYFSKDKEGTIRDTSGDTKQDQGAYELIMKDKERLLSPEEPLQFIFSHSALREGWDNPNVFQICTLNETGAYVKKRQEIGRGLRLPVTAEGNRVFDRSVNVLTVVANESYETFARNLQEEIEDETGQAFGEGRIADKRKRRKIHLKKHWELDERFLELWDRVKQKTRYAVEIDHGAFLTKASEAVRAIVSQAPRIRADIAELTFDARRGILAKPPRRVRTGQLFNQSLPVPDFLTYIANNTRLRRETVADIIVRGNALGRIRSNPQYMMDAIVEEVKRVMQTMIIDGVKYERIADAEYEMQIFKNAEIESYISNMRVVEKQEKTLYDHVLYDSGVEEQFAAELEARDEVEFYLKLPPDFKIETPLGTYNPDWALVFTGDTRLYLVAETKGTNRLEELSLAEQLKIKAGQKHFTAVGKAIFVAPVKNMDDLVTRVASGTA